MAAATSVGKEEKKNNRPTGKHMRGGVAYDDCVAWHYDQKQRRDDGSVGHGILDEYSELEPSGDEVFSSDGPCDAATRRKVDTQWAREIYAAVAGDKEDAHDNGMEAVSCCHQISRHLDVMQGDFDEWPGEQVLHQSFALNEKVVYECWTSMTGERETVRHVHDRAVLLAMSPTHEVNHHWAWQRAWDMVKVGDSRLPRSWRMLEEKYEYPIMAYYMEHFSFRTSAFGIMWIIGDGTEPEFDAYPFVPIGTVEYFFTAERKIRDEKRLLEKQKIDSALERHDKEMADRPVYVRARRARKTPAPVVAVAAAAAITAPASPALSPVPVPYGASSPLSD